MGCDFELWAPESAPIAAGSIDIRPTWVGNMAILIAALEHGTEDGKAAARAELAGLARKLDKLNPAVDAKDDALAAAERFISGFEDDELQEGIPELLEQIRGAYIA